MTSQTTLITGALGHIGSRLIRQLDLSVFTGEVRLLDNLESRRFPSLYGLPNNCNFAFVQQDILTADFDRLLRDVDTVIHLAAITDAEGSHKIPAEVEAVNFHGLRRVADACLSHGVRLLFPSTTSVYGSQASRVDEHCRELRPQSPYAEAKLNSEVYLQMLAREGLKMVICRFGTIFGHSVGMRYDTAVNRFTWQAANGAPVTVWTTAWKQKRPYLYLGDCIEAINFFARKNLFNGEVYNILTDNFTVEDVVGAIRTLIPEIAVTFVDSPIMNQLSYEVDDTKIRSFGFKPTGDLNEGIKEAVDQLQGLIPRPAVKG